MAIWFLYTSVPPIHAPLDSRAAPRVSSPRIASPGSVSPPRSSQAAANSTRALVLASMCFNARVRPVLRGGTTFRKSTRPGTAASRPAATPRIARYDPACQNDGRASAHPSASNSSAPVRKANGNGTSIGCNGCP
jgi:hypothetical protein